MKSSSASMKNLRRHPEVDSEIERWAEILSQKSDWSPPRFFAAIRAAYRRIRERPTHAHFVHKEFRRYNIPGQSHAVIYREEADAIYVIAVMHEKRHPDYWKERMDEDEAVL